MDWWLQLDKYFVGCCIKLKQEGGLFSPEVDPYAFQQNDVVGNPKCDTRWTSFKNSFLHGELSLQANLIASFVAEVPLIPTNDTLWMLTPQVCISIKYYFTLTLDAHKCNLGCSDDSSKIWSHPRQIFQKMNYFWSIWHTIVDIFENFEQRRIYVIAICI